MMNVRRKDLESWLPPHLWGSINPLLVGLGQVRSPPLASFAYPVRLPQSDLALFAHPPRSQLICKAPTPLCSSCTLGPTGLCPSSSVRPNTSSAPSAAKTELGAAGPSPFKRKQLVKIELEQEMIAASSSADLTSQSTGEDGLVRMEEVKEEVVAVKTEAEL